jgi:tryptophan synthase alpha chain
MGYANSFLAATRGGSGDDLAGRLVAAGVDGVLIPDLPYDHELALREAFAAHGIAAPVLVAPTTTRERGAAVAAAATGFVYYVTETGVTGTDRPDVAATYDHVTRIREHTALPVVVGFGIQTADQVRSLRGAADGLVVGSALVARAHAAPPGHEVAGIGALAAELAAAAGAAPSGQHTMGNVKEDVAC